MLPVAIHTKLLDAWKQSLDVDDARTVTTVHATGVAPDRSSINAKVVPPFVPQYTALEDPKSRTEKLVYVTHKARLFHSVTTVPEVV